MTPTLRRAVERAVFEASGRPVTIADSTPVGGGCINHSEIALLQGGGRLFVKSNSGPEAEWPLPPGSPERRELYRLYHLLNHLNLFGTGYRGRCVEIARRFA